MARGSSKSDTVLVGQKTPNGTLYSRVPKGEVMNYQSISLPPKAPTDPEQKKMDKALTAARKGATKDEKARNVELEAAYRKAEADKKAYMNSEEYKAVEALRDKHSKLEEEYNYDLPSTYYRKWNEDAPQSAKDASDAAARRLKELNKASQDTFDAWRVVRDDVSAKEGRKERAGKTLPDIPGIRRDSEGYFDIDDLRRNPEGAAQLAKITNATLKQVQKELGRDAASEARLNGEDSGRFSGKVERTTTVSIPSKNRSGSKFANLEFKIVADVDYKDDPYGDSSTNVTDYKIYVKSRG